MIHYKFKYYEDEYDFKIPKRIYVYEIDNSCPGNILNQLIELELYPLHRYANSYIMRYRLITSNKVGSYKVGDYLFPIEISINKIKYISEEQYNKLKAFL